MTTAILDESKVLEALRQVMDPELGCNLVDLGLIYDVKITGGFVAVTMTVTTPGCPMHDSLRLGVHNALMNLEGVTAAEVELAFDPPWHPSMMTEVGRALTGATSF
jgi:metal-sulfur cluster biosynthetic enzyme